jgi:hypothetical protein
MALDNKKSLLQPSSTQAQQYRLQYSNLAPGGVVPPTQTGGLSAPANARPAVSTFVQAPAPVSLQAPATIPPPPPAPAPVPTPAASTVPVEWSKTAMYFDGTNLMSSSLEPIDFGYNFTGSNEGLSIMVALKPFSWTPVTTSGHAYTILHMYSGSEASQSINISLIDGAVQAVVKNNGQTATFTRSIPNPGSTATLGNGYTLLSFDFLNRSVWPGDFTLYTRVNAGSSNLNLPSPWPTQISSSFTDMDHLYIGGTQFEPGKNFIGNIAFVALKKGLFGQSLTGKVVNGSIKPKALATNNSFMSRVYTFQEPVGNSFAVETTGSQATKQVSLILSGSIYPALASSYFTL